MGSIRARGGLECATGFRRSCTTKIRRCCERLCIFEKASLICNWGEFEVGCSGAGQVQRLCGGWRFSSGIFVKKFLDRRWRCLARSFAKEL